MFNSKLCFQLIGANYVLLNPADVLFLEADRQVCNIYLMDGARLVAVRHLGYYKKELIESYQFLELSKSVVVNGIHIVKYSPRERMIQLLSGLNLPVSKSRQEHLNKLFRQQHDLWIKYSNTSDDFELEG